MKQNSNTNGTLKVMVENVVGYSGQCAQLYLASSQACHLNWKKQIYRLNIIGLKIPTGGRQTSWLFTSMTQELNYDLTRKTSRLVVRAAAS